MENKKILKLIWIVTAAVLAAGIVAAAIAIPLSMKKGKSELTLSYDGTAGGVKAYDTLELGFRYDAEVKNPYDTDEIAMDAVILRPDGAKDTVPMFWFEDQSRSLSGGVEELRPQGVSDWRLRYTPTSAGTYKIEIAVKDKKNKKSFTYSPAKLKFEVAGGMKDGFLTVAADKTHLRFANGRSFTGIGHNLCGWEWAGVDNMRGTYDYDDWFSAMARNGANMAQFDLSEGDNIEWTKRENELPYASGYNGVGRYNQQAAWKTDYKVKQAGELGIYYRFSLFHWEDFDTETGNFPDWGWERNPYNEKNGGSCKSVSEFFTQETAKRQVKNYLRYAAARWGYSLNLMLWELWNEVDAPDMAWGAGDNYARLQGAITTWHDEMAQYLRSADCGKHLITTSFADSGAGDNIWKLASIDVTTFHRYTMYNSGGEAQYDGVTALNNIISSRTKVYGKPVLAGEFALSPGGDIQRNTDPEGIGFHNQIWSSLFSGSFGTAMHWTWGSYVDRQDLYPHYKPLSAFLRYEDLTGMKLSHNIRGSESYLYQAMNSATRAFLWVKDRNYDYAPVVINGYRPVKMTGVSVEIPGLTNGEYRMYAYDTYTGDLLAEQALTVTGGKAVVPVPDFTRDVAIKLIAEQDVWTFCALGAGKPNDGMTYSGDAVSLYASGTDIGGMSDDAGFAYRKVTGDFDFTVRLASMTYSAEKAKAAIMVRQTETGSSKMAALAMNGMGEYNLIERQSSIGTQGDWKEFGRGAYLKLERRGNTVSAYISANGTDFTLAGKVEFNSLNDTLLVGVAASSYNTLGYHDARFEQISLIQR